MGRCKRGGEILDRRRSYLESRLARAALWTSFACLSLHPNTHNSHCHFHHPRCVSSYTHVHTQHSHQHSHSLVIILHTQQSSSFSSPSVSSCTHVHTAAHTNEQATVPVSFKMTYQCSEKPIRAVGSLPKVAIETAPMFG